MDLVTLIASAIGAFVVAFVICWLAWRWRKTSLPSEEWNRLSRRQELVESENLRLQDRVNLLTEQSEEFPVLRTAISERDAKLLQMEHELGIAQAREIGAVTRRDQTHEELVDVRARERQLQSEVLELREFRDEANERLAQADKVIAQGRIDEAGLAGAGTGAGPLDEVEDQTESVRVAELRTQLAEANERIDELSRRTESGREPQIIDLRREEEGVLDLTTHTGSIVPEPALIGSTRTTSDSAEAEQLRVQLARLRRRAEASSALAADLRYRLDNQTHKARQLRNQLESGADSPSDTPTRAGR